MTRCITTIVTHATIVAHHKSGVSKWMRRKSGVSKWIQNVNEWIHRKSGVSKWRHRYSGAPKFWLRRNALEPKFWLGCSASNASRHRARGILFACVHGRARNGARKLSKTFFTSCTEKFLKTFFKIFVCTRHVGRKFEKLFLEFTVQIWTQPQAVGARGNTHNGSSFDDTCRIFRAHGLGFLSSMTRRIARLRARLRVAYPL